MDFHTRGLPASRRKLHNFGGSIDIATWQTEFWRPEPDGVQNVFKAGFVLEYIVIGQPTGSPFTADQYQKKGNSPRQDSRDVPTIGLQSLAVSIQLIDNARGSSTVPPSRSANEVPKHTRQNIMIIFDSAQGASVEEIIPDKATWEHLPDGNESSSLELGTIVALTAVQLLFRTIADKWGAYILAMQNCVAGLEDEIYVPGADDQRAPALWEISKQLLQAERLMKEHLSLLENVQSDLFSPHHYPSSMSKDWLSPHLNEFTRMSEEMNEELKKPTAQMIDLVRSI